MNTLFIEIKAMLTACKIRKSKGKTLVQSLSLKRNVTVKSFEGLSRTQKALCPNIFERIAILIAQNPKTIYHVGTVRSAELPILHEFAHEILGHTEDEAKQEREANLFVASLVKWHYAWHFSFFRVVVLFLSVCAFVVTLFLLNPSVRINSTSMPPLTRTLAYLPTIERNEINNREVYYWTVGSGYAYHLFPNCYHIASKTNVDSGSFKDIPISKKSLCETCV